MIKLYHLKYIFLFALIFFLIGVQNLFFARFKIDTLTDGTFWLDTANTTFAYYFTIILVVMLGVEHANKTNIEFIANRQMIRDFIIDGLQASFYDFNDMENLKNKTEEWKYHVTSKINRLDAKATPLDRKAWRDNVEDNKYVSKRKYLLSTISPEYLEDNIHYIKIDYEHIQESTITNGYTTKRNQKFKKGNALWKITKDTAPKFILSIMYTSLFRGFVLTFNQLDMVYLYKLIVQLIGLIMCIIWAINYIPIFVDEHIVGPLNNRVMYIKKYLSWDERRID